jgi:hypothetical protein
MSNMRWTPRERVSVMAVSGWSTSGLGHIVEAANLRRIVVKRPYSGTSSIGMPAAGAGKND